ncbi:MAG: 6-phosphogluconolactonase [Gammaproteobacteria bacterium]
MTKIYSYDTVDHMNKAVINAITDKAATAIQHHNAFHLALAGGSTPKSIYELMAGEEFHTLLPWDKMHIYFGDERCVPADHADSNYRMAKQALLSKVPISDDHVHPIVVDVHNIPASAERYETELKNHLPMDNSTPTFDLVLLGIGDDGHTASLFPGTDILNETGKWVAAVYVEKFAAWRISITYPVINAAANVFVIAAGSGKSNIVKEVLASESAGTAYPVQEVQPRGELVWYLDAAAAAHLPSSLMTAP